jgi:hypothetical protein
VVGDGGVPSSTFLSIGIAGFSMNALFVTPAGELWLAGSVDNAIVAHGKKVGANYAWDTSLTTAGQMFTVFSDIFGPATNELWVMGARGESYHRSPLADGGASWTKLMTNATVTMSRVWGASKDDVWAIGYFGAIRHFDGSAWSVSQVSVDGVPDYAPLFGIHGSAANDVWAVGTGVALHRSTP